MAMPAMGNVGCGMHYLTRAQGGMSGPPSFQCVTQVQSGLGGCEGGLSSVACARHGCLARAVVAGPCTHGWQSAHPLTQPRCWLDLEIPKEDLHYFYS